LPEEERLEEERLEDAPEGIKILRNDKPYLKISNHHFQLQCLSRMK
jgi:hypothetical protein